MPSHPPVPPLLSQYISHVPSSSLTLLTSTLAATTSWLVLRFIHAVLKIAVRDEPDHFPADTKVILVSWLRDGNFWRDGGKKLGINFQNIQLVDALSNGLGMSSGGLVVLEKEILSLVKSAKEPSGGETRVLLVLDGLDFLIAATAYPVPAVIDMVGEFREHVDSVIITSCADSALMQSPSTPLELSHSAFVLSMAHQARMIMSVRGLDTGVAKDISGVLRISRGAETEDEDEAVEDKECLYFVETDGGINVFERGA